MKRIACSVAFAAAVVFVGCTTPSVHPVYTADTLATDPAVVGTWKQADSGETYTVTRAGEGYHLLVKDNDKSKPREWEFAVRLTQIGAHRFADVAAAEKARDAHEEQWGPLFVPTHMFCRYAVAGDTLDIRMLNREWLRKAIANGSATVSTTPLDKETNLLTSETPQLRAFLEKHAGDDAAFSDRTVLTRVKP